MAKEATSGVGSESGTFTMKELGKLHNDCVVGCVIENDLMQFTRYIAKAEGTEGKAADGKKCFRFEEYLAHVKADGECALVDVAKALAHGK